MDVSRAFDKVPHQCLFTLLQHRRVPTVLLHLLKSYLTGREYFVRIGQAVSDFIPVLSGVPQGGIFAPFLLNVYVDSICSLNFSPGTSVILYADDLLLVKPIINVGSELEFQQDLDILTQAYSDLFLNLNGAKSKYMVVSVSPRPATVSFVPSVNGTPLIQVFQLKYLGVLLDRKFSFDLRNRFSPNFTVVIPTFRSVACGMMMPLYRLFNLCNSIYIDGCDIDAFVNGPFSVFKRFCRRHDLFVSARSKNPSILPSPL